MSEITRRRLLGSAAVGAGGVIASSVLPPALAKAAAAAPRSGALSDIEHVVVQMQENRSFDHYFGTLAGVRGFGDPAAITQSNGRSIFYQPDTQNPDGYLLPWHLNTRQTSAQAIPSTSHAWSVQHEALNITVSETLGQPTTALNNQWLMAHLGADGDANGPFTMGYYEQKDVPFHFALAQAFTLCDGYHCSLLGPTWPNRMYLMTGMIDPEGLNGGPVISNVVPSPVTGQPYTWTTYPEMLTAAGITWRLYQEEDNYGCNPLEWFQAFQSASPGSTLYQSGLEIHTHERFEWDCAGGNLAQVSYIIPTSGQSEHPSYLPAAGADFLASKLDAVAANEDLWNSTVFIVNYDENDGLFDHVIPPLPPSGAAGEFVDGVPIGGGVRVPAFIVSPWSVGGYVATENFDHTSVSQLLETIFGVTNTNITPWRRQAFGDLTSALGMSAGQPSSMPKLPKTINEFWKAEDDVQFNPAPQVPGAKQKVPVQAKKRSASAVVPWTPQDPSVRSSQTRRPMPVPASRLIENRTTHRKDFIDGRTDKVYLSKLAAVEGQTVPSSVTSAYIPGITGGVIAIADVSTRALASSVTGSTNSPFAVAATPDGTEVWVTESGGNTVSVISTSTNAVTDTVVVGTYPQGIAIAPSGKTVYVANTGPNTGKGGSTTISVINQATQAVTATIGVGEAPKGILVTPDGLLVAVTCSDGVYTATTATRSVTKSPVIFQTPMGIAVTPDNSQLWVADSEGGQVVVLSAGDLQQGAAIPVSGTPWRVAISSDASTAYVGNANADTVTVIDIATQKVTATIPLGSFSTPNDVTKDSSYTQVHHMPTWIAEAPDGSIWVTCNVSSSVAIIDPTSGAVVDSFEVGLGDSPAGIAFA
jgi:phospholipase C